MFQLFLPWACNALLPPHVKCAGWQLLLLDANQIRTPRKSGASTQRQRSAVIPAHFLFFSCFLPSFCICLAGRLVCAKVYLSIHLGPKLTGGDNIETVIFPTWLTFIVLDRKCSLMFHSKTHVLMHLCHNDLLFGQSLVLP